jgi:hypothetical protein
MEYVAVHGDAHDRLSVQERWRGGLCRGDDRVRMASMPPRSN